MNARVLEIDAQMKANKSAQTPSGSLMLLILRTLLRAERSEPRR